MRKIETPDVALFQDLRGVVSYNDGDNLNLDRIIYDPKSLRVSLDGSLLRNTKTSIEDIVNGENFFSDFWITKGYTAAEDARYGFFFDLQSFMISRSRFSGLYYDDDIADELFGGFTAQNSLMTNKFNAISEIISLKMKKRNIDFEGSIDVNNLGTTAREKQTPPTHQFPEKFVSTPVRIKIDISGGVSCEDDERAYSKYSSGHAKSGVHFYHGTDNYAHEYSAQIVARYQYGVELTIADPAAFYLRNKAQELRHQEQIVKTVIDFIVNSPPGDPDNAGSGIGLYNYNTHSLQKPLTQINFVDDRGRIKGTVYNMVQKAVQVYDACLLKFKIKKESCLETLMALVKGTGQNGLIPISNLEIINRAIEFLAYELEQISSSEFLDNSGSENISNKDVLERRGTCERKMPLIQLNYYFKDIYEYGREHGQGYAYIEGTGGEDMYGLRFINPRAYALRSNMEFNKYFTKKGDLPNWTQGTFSDPAVQYFTPFLIRAPGSLVDAVVQPSYSTQQNEISKYDIDDYADLLSGLVKIKYGSQYLNKPYMKVQNRGTNLDTQNRKLFNGLVDSLEVHHGCTIDESHQQYFSVPQIHRNFVIDTEALGNTSIYSTWPGVAPPTEIGPDAIRLIQGALNDRSTFPRNWSLSSSADLVEAARGISEGTDVTLEKLDFPAPPNVEPPIKLTMGILGELELDPELRIDTEDETETYMDLLFNSLKNQAKNLIPATSEFRIANQIEGNFRSFPNQIKSMLIFSLRKNNMEDLGENGFDAKRTMLLDQDPKGEELDVSSALPLQFPSFSQTEDPMKIYAKLAAFWMNYKQIGCVEYLDGFERVGSFEGSLYLDPPLDENSPPYPADPQGAEPANQSDTSQFEVDTPIDTNEQNQASRILGNYEESSMPGVVVSPGVLESVSNAFVDQGGSSLGRMPGADISTPEFNPPPESTVVFPDLDLSGVNVSLEGIGGNMDFTPPDPFHFKCYGKKLKMPVWRKLTFDKLVEIYNSDFNFLCRVRPYVQDSPIHDKLGNIVGYSDAGFEKSLSQVFDLPIYDQYFVLSKNQPMQFFKGVEKAPQHIYQGEIDIPSDILINLPDNITDLMTLPDLTGIGYMPPQQERENPAIQDFDFTPRNTPPPAQAPEGATPTNPLTNPSGIDPSRMQNINFNPQLATDLMSMSSVSPVIPNNTQVAVGRLMSRNTTFPGGGGGSGY